MDNRKQKMRQQEMKILKERMIRASKPTENQEWKELHKWATSRMSISKLTITQFLKSIGIEPTSMYRSLIGPTGSNCTYFIEGNDRDEFKENLKKAKKKYGNDPFVEQFTDSFQEKVEDLRVMLQPEAKENGVSDIILVSNNPFKIIYCVQKEYIETYIQELTNKFNINGKTPETEIHVYEYAHSYQSPICLKYKGYGTVTNIMI